MTLAERIHQFHLVPPVDLFCEIARGSADRQQMMRGDYDFALRHDHSIYGSAIYDRRNTTSQISALNCIDDISRQADCIRAMRICREHSHSEVPQQETPGKDGTTLRRRTQNFHSTRNNRLRAASCAVPTQEQWPKSYMERS